MLPPRKYPIPNQDSKSPAIQPQIKVMTWVDRTGRKRPYDGQTAEKRYRSNHLITNLSQKN